MSNWRIDTTELIEPAVKAGIFSGMITPFHPIPESLDEDVRGAVGMAFADLPPLRTPEEAFRHCFLAQEKVRADNEPYGVRLQAYYHAVVALDVAVELLVQERNAALMESNASPAMLWRDVMMGALYASSIGLISGVRAISAERVLIEQMGQKAYVQNLAERKTRSRVMQGAMERIWSLESSKVSQPIFCANCFVFLGHNTDEVAERLGVFSNTLGTWTECPRCKRPTLLSL